MTKTKQDPAEKLQKISDAFDVANETLSEITVDVENSEIMPDDGEIDKFTSEMFSASQLKADFMLVRNNLIQLINVGQTLLKSAQFLDLDELPATKMEALASLQRAASDNLKTLITIYKDMREIEVGKGSNVRKTETKNTSVFIGTNQKLLEALSDVKIEKRVPMIDVSAIQKEREAQRQKRAVITTHG